VNAAFAIPYRETDERRAELSAYVLAWIHGHHPEWPTHEGESPAGPFNRGAAINDAARKAGDWDALIVHDADNICDPETLRWAVRMAIATGKVYYPFETYTYLDKFTSDRLMHKGNWFIAPELHPQHVFQTTVRRKHYSGIQVIPRQTYESAGGYIELTGWGAEDAIMNTIFETFGPGVEWLSGGAFHLWHHAWRNNPKDADNVRNHRIWADVHHIAQHEHPIALRQYLATVGHLVP
jgi:hypothetical protein